MKIKFLPLAANAALILGASSANAALIAAFDFQTTTTGGTAAVASSTTVSSPLVYNSNFGTATLYLDGTNGSSTFLTGVTNPEVTSFGGSAVNVSGGLSTTITGAASLALANLSANAKTAVFVFSMANMENLSITYSTQGTATGFNKQSWSYSTDGVTFVPFDTYDSTVATMFPTVGVVTLDTLTALDGLNKVYIGLTLSGATNASGNNRLDNIQFNTVPEPASALLGALGFLAILRRRR